MEFSGKLDRDKIMEIAARSASTWPAAEGHGRSQAEADHRAQHGARRALGVRGTPAFVIGKQFVPGAVDAAR
jgi:hypothetical protein